MDASEKQIQNAIIAYLNSTGCYVWRNNSGMVHMRDRFGHDRMWRAGIKGGADILGIASNGRFIAIEAKRKGKNATPIQEAFLQEIKQRGGYSGVARSIEDAIQIMTQYGTNTPES